MANYIRYLKDGNDTVYPRTVASAVALPDGTSVEAALSNIGTPQIRVTGDLATALNVPEGTPLGTVLLTLYEDTSNTLASAQIINS